METIVINVQNRDVKGGSTGARLRNEGIIPAVVYSGGTDAKLVSLTDREYRRALVGHGSSQLFKFESEQKEINGQLALVREIQIEPLKGKPLHIDFLAIDANKRIVVEVPVELTGESPSVKAGEGLLNQSMRELAIECLPTEIPSVLKIDLSQLNMGDSIHAGDVTLPAGAKLKTDKTFTVVSVVHKKEEVLATVTAAPAEGAADAAAPAAGAAAAAAPAAEAKGGKKEKD